MNEIIRKGDKEALRQKLSLKETSLTQAKELVTLAKSNGTKVIEAILINRITEALNFYSIEERQQLIVDIISELSEDIYSSGWNDNIEHELWDWIENKVPDSIRHRIEKKDLIDLGNLVSKLDLWVIWDEEKEAIAISLTEWTLQYK